MAVLAHLILLSGGVSVARIAMSVSSILTFAFHDLILSGPHSGPDGMIEVGRKEYKWRPSERDLVAFGVSVWTIYGVYTYRDIAVSLG
jgi:hypothetical protein